MNAFKIPYLFFDGASKSNPGKVGARGILIGQVRKNSIAFEWGLGTTSNNKVEAYGLLLGEKFLRKRSILNPIILGDPIILIQSMVKKVDPKNTALIQIKKRIMHHLINMG